MKKILLFDFDGTLADSIPTVLASFRDAFEEMEEKYPGDEAITRGIGKHLQDIFAEFLSAEKVDFAVETYRKHYIKRQNRGEVKAFPHTISAIRALKEKGFQMGIVTTKLAKFTHPLVDEFGLTDCFETIVGAEHVEKCKPDPEPLFFAAKKMDVSPADCVYIGDATHDAEAAKAAGMDFIAVNTGTASKEELEKYGEVFEDLEGLFISFCKKNV